MFCPKCGQQQVADHTRFCSRCGLALSGLGEYVAGDAVLTVRKHAETMAVNSPRRKGVRRGAKVMFLSGVLAPVCFGLCFLVDGPAPLLIPFSIFLAGLFCLLYAQLFGDELLLANSQQNQPSSFAAMPEGAALPEASNLRMTSGAQQSRTAEIVPPPSVTEHTTRLLDREEG